MPRTCRTHAAPRARSLPAVGWLELTRARSLRCAPPACRLVLVQISRRHMRIECRGGKYLAFDDGSTYGTTINEWLLGNKENQVLKDGDSILIGASRFRFQMCA